MTPAELFSVYALDRATIGLSGYDVERFAHLTCFTPKLRDREGLVTFAALTPGQAQKEVDAQNHYFQTVGVPFRWRHFALGSPANTQETLAQCGFVLSSMASLLVHHFSSPCKAKLPEGLGLKLVRIDSLAGIHDVLAVYSVALGRSHSHLKQSFSMQFEQDPDTLSFFCVYRGAVPIAAGWTEYPRGSQFPELHPAAVLPSWRGRGLGLALDCARAEEAHGRFYEQVMAVSSPERASRMVSIGFEQVTTRITMRPRSAKRWDTVSRPTVAFPDPPIPLGAMEEL